MSGEDIKTGYQRLFEQHTSPPPSNKSAEESLDELLTGCCPGHPTGGGAPGSGTPVHRAPLDALRDMFRMELVPVFDELRAKYQAYGIALAMDVAEFLNGGRRLSIEFHMPPRSIKLEGTAVNEGVAFNEIQSFDGIPGAISSGPMLRTRLLNAERFRDFVCAQLAPLVRTKLRQK